MKKKWHIFCTLSGKFNSCSGGKSIKTMKKKPSESVNLKGSTLEKVFLGETAKSNTTLEAFKKEYFNQVKDLLTEHLARSTETIKRCTEIAEIEELKFMPLEPHIVEKTALFMDKFHVEYKLNFVQAMYLLREALYSYQVAYMNQINLIVQGHHAYLNSRKPTILGVDGSRVN